MKPDWNDTLSFLTVVQLVLLTFVTLRYKRGNRKSNRLLAAFMAANAVLMASVLRGFVPGIAGILGVVGGSSYLLLAPLLYFYVRSLCFRDAPLKPAHLFHAVPFALSLILLTLAVTAPHPAREGQAHAFATLPLNAKQVLLHLQVLSYLLAIVVLLRSYRTELRDQYSSVEELDMPWLNLLLGAFAVMWFLDLSSWILTTYGLIPPDATSFLYFLSVLINLVFTLAVTYRGLLAGATPGGVQSPAPRYASSRLTQPDCDAIAGRLNEFMKERKPYLTPSVTVDDLATMLDVPARHLSQAIHSSLRRNFYDLVNSYRIEEAKERIRDERFSHLTLLALAFDVGFNSKSTFNDAFKKHTGLTPKEYRRQSVSSPVLEPDA